MYFETNDEFITYILEQYGTLKDKFVKYYEDTGLTIVI